MWQSPPAGQAGLRVHPGSLPMKKCAKKITQDEYKNTRKYMYLYKYTLMAINKHFHPTLFSAPDVKTIR